MSTVQATPCTTAITYTGQVFLTDKQVASRYQVGRQTPWRWAREGHFPTPVKLAEACTRWRLSDLEAWEAAQ